MQIDVKRIYRNILCFGTVIVLSGCVSSEGTGSGGRAVSPIVINSSPDTTQTLKSPGNQEQLSAEQQKVAPKFKSRQDTLDASVVTKSKYSSSSQSDTESEEHSIYTVQIGAYNKAANALSIQKRAKERFPGQAVFSEYLKDSKMYRVNIGRYDNREDAVCLFDSIKQKYSNEYKQCWVNFIP